MSTPAPSPSAPPDLGPPSLRRRVYELVGGAGDVTAPQTAAGERVDAKGRPFETFMLWLIVLNVAALMLETVGELHARFGDLFHAFEVFSVTIFTLEYLLRLWSCTADARYRHPLWGRLRFMVTPMAVIDLAAILPFWLPFVSVDARVLRTLRLVRIFRVAKLGRYSKAFTALVNVIRSRKDELATSLFVLILLLIVASTLMYYAENEAQPDKFTSIPASMWWGVATLTTIGYGDVFPITPLGKILAAVVATLGIGVFALPTAILGSAFLEQLQAKKKAAEEATPKTCPHCGRDITKHA